MARTVGLTQQFTRSNRFPHVRRLEGKHGAIWAKNIELYPVGSDRTGSADGDPSVRPWGRESLEARIPLESALTPNRVVRVPTRRLDDLFASLGCIDFVKCDVEAHELYVLRGASQILRVHRPAWLIEVSGNPDDPNSSAFELLRLMKNAGYQAYLLEEGENGPQSAAKRSGNCFFLRPEHVRRLGVCGQS